ncbi:MAG: ECF transporter S component [Clostridiales bacterium]|nr:ECF transporter S component [Clostridiales bacterium]
MNRTFKLTSIAMLTALSIVTNMFTVPLSGSNSMSFTIAICFFTGIYFGILPAAFVGFTGDLLAHFIYPHGPYNVFIALSTTLFGVICALIYKLKLPKIVNLIITTVICYVVCLCAFNTFGLWLQIIVGAKTSPIGTYGIYSVIDFVRMEKGGIKKSFWLYLAGRAPWSAINIVINAVIIAGLQQSGVIEKLMAKVRSIDENKAKEKQSLQKDDNA